MGLIRGLWISLKRCSVPGISCREIRPKQNEGFHCCIFGTSVFIGCQDQLSGSVCFSVFRWQSPAQSSDYSAVQEWEYIFCELSSHAAELIKWLTLFQRLDVCNNEGSVCFKELADVHKTSCLLDLALGKERAILSYSWWIFLAECRLLRLPPLTPQQQQCLANLVANRAADITQACGSQDITDLTDAREVNKPFL